ncbi:MAG: alpha-hydroxy-acid oxidizing protein [Xanthomonadales bacterium]|nr:alpha-hydroxy-acid oxidizing protein [Xanthomonadales bacterium]
MSLLRTLYRGKDYRRALSIEELRLIGQRRIPNFSFEYVEGGAETETALRRNIDVFNRYSFKPSTLVNTEGRTSDIQLFGKPSPSPLLISPTGLNGLLHHRGDIALAKAAANAGIPFCLSTVSNATLEDVAVEAGGRLWMQLYMMNDRNIARDIITRAEKAGYEALIFTTDANVFGRREWDLRNYRQPGKLSLRNILDIALHPRWVADVLIPNGIPLFENVLEYLPPQMRTVKGGVASLPGMLAPDISWGDLRWIRDMWPRKLILKGVLNVADAKQAASLGCDGVILTNHGGRQLDSCVTPIEVLAEIRQAVGEQLTILIDSGFRRGSDVLKAIALGADAVMIGRPTLYGLAAGGQPGVEHALALLNEEIDRVLGQLGCRSVQQLNPKMLVKNDP